MDDLEHMHWIKARFDESIPAPTYRTVPENPPERRYVLLFDDAVWTAPSKQGPWTRYVETVKRPWWRVALDWLCFALVGVLPRRRTP